ncbi:hypothetical protein DL95DRAFT_392248, partial [Leptodontidium sp. 2 PMI_412]
MCPSFCPPRTCTPFTTTKTQGCTLSTRPTITSTTSMLPRSCPTVTSINPTKCPSQTSCTVCVPITKTANCSTTSTNCPSQT